MATDDRLELIYGSTTIDLLRGPVRVAQDGWAPALIAFSDSQLGNRSLYDPVDEELELEIVATGAQNPGQVWGQIVDALDQARRWCDGEPGATFIRLRARPAGSRLGAGAYLEAAVYGGEARALHPSYTRALEANTVAPARVTIRHGVWLAASPTGVTSSSSLASQQLAQVSYADEPRALSPVDLAVVPQNTASISGDAPITGVILCGETQGAFRIVDLTAATAGGWSTITATYTARGGSHLRYTPGATTTEIGPFAFASPVPGGPDGFTVATPYLLAKANSGRQFQVRLRFASGFDDPGALLYTEWITVSGTTATPYAFMPVPSAYSHTTVYVEVKVLSGSGGSLDLDTLVLHVDEGPASYAVRLAEGAFLVGTSGGSLYTAITISNDPGVGVAPAVIQSPSSSPWGSGTIRHMGYTGDAAIHMGQNLFVLPLLCGGSSGGNFTPTTGAAFSTFRIQTWRRAAYLALE